MHEKQIIPHPPGLTLGDIYYVLFRRKWLIILLSVAGIVAALAVYLTRRPLYQSEAKLFIRYVVESKSLSPSGIDPQMKSPDSRGDNIINSEVEILTSLDLAELVADAVGADKILAKAGGGSNRYTAAILIRRGLNVEVPKNSNVLRVVFQHPDREVVQPVLTQLIASYLKKHVEIHRAIGVFDDILTQQTDTIRSKLSQTEEELRKSKLKAGVISLEETKKAYTEEKSKIRQALLSADAELAERIAAFKEMEKHVPTAKPEATPSELGVPSGKVTEYKRICARLDSLWKREQELTTQFTGENSLVKAAREQIAEAEKSKQKLEEESPKLTKLDIATAKPSDKPATPAVDLAAEATRIAGLQAKIKFLNAQMEKVTTEEGGVNEMEPTITQLQRKKELEETQYRYYSSSLEQARFDEALSSGKISNISVAQSPSPPFTEASILQKQLAMILAGGVLGGLGLAFLLELYLDRSVRRPAEIEVKLNLPLLVAIPDTSRNGHSRRLKLKLARKESKRLKAPGESTTTTGEPSVAEKNGKVEIAPWDASHCLRPFYEGLRDRLVTYFEVRNLTHKPKLVALTGCGKGAGVTTIAAGLAACLSETGDGNVLLVDMNVEHGAAHAFYKGKPGCGLDDVLENGARGTALVQDNLYVATVGANSDKLPRILPKRFTNLIPKLKASDYDYIIFDMPPISQISVTPRLAGFMDLVLLVLESEKTDREAAMRATALLSESKANVSVVLNKTRSYLPGWLHQEM